MPWRIQKARTRGSSLAIEVDAEAALLRELHPLAEVLRLHLVAIHLLAVLEDRVAGVQIDAVLAGNEGEGLVDVGHQLLGRAGLAGIVACRLDAAGGAQRVLEPAHVVALPTVHRNRYFAKRGDRFLRIDADSGVLFPCSFVCGFAHFAFSFSGMV